MYNHNISFFAYLSPNVPWWRLLCWRLVLVCTLNLNLFIFSLNLLTSLHQCATHWRPNFNCILSLLLLTLRIELSKSQNPTKTFSLSLPLFCYNVKLSFSHIFYYIFFPYFLTFIIDFISLELKLLPPNVVNNGGNLSKFITFIYSLSLELISISLINCLSILYNINPSHFLFSIFFLSFLNFSVLLLIVFDTLFKLKILLCYFYTILLPLNINLK